MQWDEPSSILRPDRVSAWELEPLVASNPLSSQPTQRNKRPRPTVLPSPTADAAVLGNTTLLNSNKSFLILDGTLLILSLCTRRVETYG